MKSDLLSLLDTCYKSYSTDEIGDVISNLNSIWGSRSFNECSLDEILGVLVSAVKESPEKNIDEMPVGFDDLLSTIDPEYKGGLT